MAEKIEHSLREKSQAFEELQRKANEFHQSIKGFQKELLQSGREFMQFFQEFNRLTGQTTGAGAAPPAAPGAGGAGGGAGQVGSRDFGQSIERAAQTPSSGEGGGPKSRAERIVQGEQIRRRNMQRAGLTGVGQPGGGLVDPNEVADANREIIQGSFQQSISEGAGAQATGGGAGYRTEPRDPKKRRRREIAVQQQQTETQQAALKERLMAKYGDRPEITDMRESSTGAMVASGAEKRRGEALAAVGGPGHLQYDIRDIPGTRRTAEQFQQQKQQMQQRVEGIRASAQAGGTDKAIATALENMVRKMDKSNDRFARAVQTFERLSSDPEVEQDSKEMVRAMGELKRSMEELNNTNEDLAETNKAAAQVPGGAGGGGGGQDFRERLIGGAQRFAAGVAGVAGLAAGVGGAATQTMAAMEQEAAGAERRAAVARGELNQTVFQRELASVDMTQPENLLRYRADLLFGRQHDYIGTDPSRGMRGALEEQELKIQAAKHGWYGSLISGTAQVAGGVGALGAGAIAAGTGGAGAALGAGMAAQGIQGVTGGVNELVQGTAGNLYTQLQHGGMMGMVGDMFYDDRRAKRHADFIKKAATAETSVEAIQALQQMERGEIQSEYARQIPAMEEYERLITTQQEGARLVGQYAYDREDFLDGLMGEPETNPRVQFMNRLARRRRRFARDPDARMSRLAREGMQRAPFQLGEMRENVEQAEEALNLVRRARGEGEAPAGETAMGVAVMGPGGLVADEDRARERLRERGLEGMTAAQAKEGLERARQRLERAQFPEDAGRAVQEAYFERVAGREGYFEYLRPGERDATQRQIGFMPGQRADTLSARLEMQPHELMQRMNQITNVIGNVRMRDIPVELRGEAARRAARQGKDVVGAQATFDEAETLTMMGRSGLGSFDQLLGNIVQINRAAGGQNNINQLQQIMSEGVKAGFDKSRVAQQFVQTTTELARNLQITNVDAIAPDVARGAQVLGAEPGMADEAGLARAARGIQGLSQFTAQRGGLVGALKTASAAGAGVGLSEGLPMLQGLSSVQARNWLQQLEEGDVTDPRLRNFLRLQEGDTREDRVEAARRGIRGTLRGAESPFGGLADILGHGDESDHIKNIQESVQKREKVKEDVQQDRVKEDLQKIFGGKDGAPEATGRPDTFEEFMQTDRMKATIREARMDAADKPVREAFRDFVSEQANVAETMGLDQEAGVMRAVQRVREEVPAFANMSREEQNRIVQEQIEGGQETFRDPARVNRQKFLDTMMQDLRSKTEGMSIPRYRQYLRTGAEPIEFDGERIDEAELEQMERAGTLGRFQRHLEQRGTLDFIRGAEAPAAGGAADIQRVHVDNAQSIAGYLAVFMKEADAADLVGDPNKNTDK